MTATEGQPPPGAPVGQDLLVFVADVAPYHLADGRQAPAGVHRSLGSAATAFAQVASLCGLGYHHAQGVADLELDVLARARVLVLFTIGETPWAPPQKALITEAVADGRTGLVGVHSATDSAYGWADFGPLLGARFAGHPVTGELSVQVVDRAHPATSHLPPLWHVREELYLFRDLVADAHILLAVPLGPADEGAAPTLLPLCWCIERGRARTFYTVFGHFLEAYEDGAYLQHLRGAVEWVTARPAAAPA
jgi:type 1 glutamine amidotransferase